MSASTEASYTFVTNGLTNSSTSIVKRNFPQGTTGQSRIGLQSFNHLNTKNKQKKSFTGGEEAATPEAKARNQISPEGRSSDLHPIHAVSPATIRYRQWRATTIQHDRKQNRPNPHHRRTYNRETTEEPPNRPHKQQEEAAVRRESLSCVEKPVHSVSSHRADPLSRTHSAGKNK
ncbi:unnamed protein product [Microthlaspi erraticum]|uniref:Uncharacterized protein n=1 Tax=Microthlaspi erraticum TaxID=1685480 RepID=A0A6D2HWA1_9BRAS|nr:unnamed protein product [Microthlaspi erraticum]